MRFVIDANNEPAGLPGYRLNKTNDCPVRPAQKLGVAVVLWRRLALASAASLALLACGGGDVDVSLAAAPAPMESLQGVAAVGAALGNSPVKIRCPREKNATYPISVSLSKSAALEDLAVFKVTDGSNTDQTIFDGQVIRLSTKGSLPKPLNTVENFYVVNKTADGFQLSRTPSGAALSTYASTQAGLHAATTGKMLEKTVTTAADGAYAVNFSEDLKVQKPCLLEVSAYGAKLHAVSSGLSGVANITPLTEALLAILVETGDLARYFTEFGEANVAEFRQLASAKNIDVAWSKLKMMLASNGIDTSAITTEPISASLSAANVLKTGDAHDKLLDKLAFNTASQSPYNFLQGKEKMLTLIKLDSKGLPLKNQFAKWSDTGSEEAGTKWDCVHDTANDLFWEVKPNFPGHLRHREHKYTWFFDTKVVGGRGRESLVFNGGSAGTEFSQSCQGIADPAKCNTENYVRAVNAARLCGFESWALPDVDTLEKFPLNYESVRTNAYAVTISESKEAVFTYTPNAGQNLIVDDQIVTLRTNDRLPNTLSQGQSYYVVGAVEKSSFQLSTVKRGKPISTLDAGGSSGSHIVEFGVLEPSLPDRLPFVNTDYFPDLKSQPLANASFWTNASSANSAQGNYAWVVNFENGKVEDRLKASTQALRLVLPVNIYSVTITEAGKAVFKYTKTAKQNSIVDDQIVTLRTNDRLPDTLSQGQSYYVVNANVVTESFELSTAKAGKSINSGKSQGPHFVVVGGLEPALPVNASVINISNANPAVFTHTKTAAEKWIANDQVVTLRTNGLLPNTLSQDQSYYVVKADADKKSFELSSKKGGGSISTEKSGSPNGPHFALTSIDECHPGIEVSRPDTRYKVNGDEVTDNVTGLVWRQCVEGLSGATCTGTAKPASFKQAQALALSAATTAKPWRLPTRSELAGLVDRKCTGVWKYKSDGITTESAASSRRAINKTVFPQEGTSAPTPYAQAIWAATNYPANLTNPDIHSQSAWIVNFYNGSVDYVDVSTANIYVWLVRGQLMPTKITAVSTDASKVDAIPQSIKISTASTSFASGNSTLLSALATFLDKTTKAITSAIDWVITTVSGSGTASLVTYSDGTEFRSTGPGVFSLVGKYLGLTDSVTITVTDAVAQSITASSVLSYLVNGASTALNAVVTFSDKTTKNVAAAVEWVVTTVSGSGRATVSSSNNASTLTPAETGIIQAIAKYLGLTSNALQITITCDAGASTANPFSSCIGSSPTPVTVSNLVVTPAIGICLGCTVSVYSKAGGLIVSGTTSRTTGKASLDTAGNTDLLLVKVTGNSTATYWDEKLLTNASFPATSSMVTMVSSFTSGAAVGVTPLTTIAARLAGVNTATLGTSTFIAQTLTAESILEAEARTLLLLGLPANFNLFEAPVAASSTDRFPTGLYGYVLTSWGASAAVSALAMFEDMVSCVPVSAVSATGVITVGVYNGPCLLAAQAMNSSLASFLMLAGAVNAAPTAAQVALATAALKASVEPAAAAAIGSTRLRSLAYTDARNYEYRLSGSTAAQNTIDSNGFYRYVFRKYKNVDGTIAAWNSGIEPRRQADLHWNGSTWVACALNFENKYTPRDAKGNNEYDYCDKREIGAGYVSFSQDVAGKKMSDVLNDVVKAGYTSLGKPSTALTTALGTETFPAGSKISMENSISLKTAPSYGTGGDDFVRVETSVACAGWTTKGAVYTSANAVTLEDIIAKYTGSDPCNVGGASGSFVGKNGVTLSSGARNESWGDTTLGIGTIGTAATVAQADAVSYYTTNTRLRVGFGPKVNNGGVAKYYSCKERYDGSIRNCDLIGSGTYAITTLGDARMLSLATLPAISMALTWERKFIEIGGKVFFGYQDRPSVGKSVGLNTKATDAILAKLGLPAVNPEVPLALTAASYQGTYDMYLDSAPTTVVSTLTISAAGQNLCKDASGIIYTCTTTSFDPATGSFTTTTGNGTSVGVMRFLTGIPTGMYTPTSGTAAAFTMVRR